MSSLGSLYYTLGIRDLTDADFKRINAKLKDAGSELRVKPVLTKDINDLLPKGLKLELDPKLKDVSNEALSRAVEGKVMRVEVMPLLTHLRKALRDATKDNPPEMEVGVRENKLRELISRVLNKQGFMLNISTVNDNYSKAIQQKLNGTAYKVKIHADAREITRSVQASLMQVQSRTFGLKITREVLYRSINEALSQKKFPISVYVNREVARNAVQTALNKASGLTDRDAINHQRLMTAEARAAKAELDRVKAAHLSAADAARTHASASINLGGALGSNIKIAGELGSAMASLYSIHAARQFLAQVVEIGGELEHQKIAMDTIFGDKGKTGQLFGQIKGLARQSPFGVMELTKSVKALSAYGVQYNEIYDTAKRLADISAATSVDINRLILAFGKTRSRGFLDGLEAKQFAYANIPIYEMVRKKLEELEGQAVTTADVMKRMKKREIGFDIVKDVLWDMTDPGGKFYNMQEALAGSVKTSWKLVRDNIELMFGEIAESGIGDILKDTAVMLQGLTRNWRTVGFMVGAAAAGLGVYKIATLGVNSAIQKETTSTYQSIIAKKQKNAEDLKAWGRIAELSKIEKMRILTADKLTNADLRQAMAAGTLNAKHIAQLFWQKKLTAEQVQYLAKTDLLDAGTAKLIQSNSRLRLSFAWLGASIKSAAASLWSFIASPWTIAIAAISALTGLWQKNREEMEKAKEIGDSIFTKATEGADNLKKTLDGIKPSEGLSDHELKQGIEEMEQAIKDYSPTPIHDINEALRTQDGLLRPLAERFDLLKEKLDGIKASFDEIEKKNIGSLMEDAINYTNESWFHDDVDTNAKDYDAALKKQSRKITEYITEHAQSARMAVRDMLDLSPAFAAATKDMNWQQSFDYLVRNAENFRSILNDRFDIAAIIDKVDYSKSISRKLNTLYEDMAKVWDFIESSAARDGIPAIENATEEVKRAYAISIKNWIQGLEVSDETKQLMYNYYSNLLKFDFETFDAQGTIAEALDKGLPAEVGTEIYQKVKNGLELTSEQQKDFNAAVEKLYLKLFESIPGARKAALNNAIANIGDDGLPHFAPDKMMTIQAQLSVRANWDQWQREVDDALGNLKPLQALIKGAADMPSFVKAVKDAHKEAQDQLDQLKPLMLKAGIDFTFGEELPEGTPSEFYTNLTAAQQKMVHDYNEYVRTLKAAEKASKTYDFDLDTDKDRDTAERDYFGGAVKERIDLLKKAKSKYEALAKAVGTDRAGRQLEESTIFEGLKANKFLPEQDIPRTLEDYLSELGRLQELLTAKGLDTKGRRELNVEIEQLKFDIRTEQVKEQLRLALDRVSRQAEQEIADWNLFDKVRKATGNQDLAMSIAFGLNASAGTDYPAMVKKQFDELARAAGSALTFDTATPEALDDAPEQVRKAWEEATKKLEQYAREQKDAIESILTEYQSLSDKLAKIDFDREEKIKTVSNSDMPEGDKAVLIQRINVEADYQKFRQSADYLKFFSGIYALTMDQAQQIGDKIRLHLDQRLQAGKISAEDYYKEIERINQQLTKLRNVKSDALTFATAGAKGLQDKKLEKADSDVLTMMTKVSQAEEDLIKAKASGNLQEIAAAELSLKLARESLGYYESLRDAIVKDREAWQDTLDVANIAANIAGGISDAFNTVRELAGALGFDTDSDAWNTAAAVIDTLTTVTTGVQKVIQSVMNGDIGGIISGSFDTLLTPFTIWSKLHDKKLQKMIDRSKEAAQIMQNQYDLLEKRMAHFLGNAAALHTGVLGGAYGKQRSLMQGQLAELEKQRKAELDKKKSDSTALEDYNREIEEMKIAIRDFAVEVAQDLYSIDLNGWAEQLGEALVDAFAAGEDAAEAFDKTVGDIMRDVTSKMISQDILAPMFGDLRDYLFGADGMSGAFGADFKLDPSEMGAMKEYLDKIKNEGIPAAQDLFDAINAATGGVLNDTEKSKSGLSAGIQSITEDTADLLASYVNAIRADVAAGRQYWSTLLESVLPQMNVIAAAQLQAQHQIAENTLRNAVAAEALLEVARTAAKSSDEMSRLLGRVTAGTAKFYIH